MPYPTPKIGYYQTECCLRCLYKIENEADLQDALDRIEENDELGELMVFETFEDAMAVFRGELSPEEEAEQLRRLRGEA